VPGLVIAAGEREVVEQGGGSSAGVRVKLSSVAFATSFTVIDREAANPDGEVVAAAKPTLATHSLFRQMIVASLHHLYTTVCPLEFGQPPRSQAGSTTLDLAAADERG
jgi:hypothetical protein